MQQAYYLLPGKVHILCLQYFLLLVGPGPANPVGPRSIAVSATMVVTPLSHVLQNVSKVYDKLRFIKSKRRAFILLIKKTCVQILSRPKFGTLIAFY